MQKVGCTGWPHTLHPLWLLWNCAPILYSSTWCLLQHMSWSIQGRCCIQHSLGVGAMCSAVPDQLFLVHMPHMVPTLGHALDSACSGCAWEQALHSTGSQSNGQWVGTAATSISSRRRKVSTAIAFSLQQQGKVIASKAPLPLNATRVICLQAGSNGPVG